MGEAEGNREGESAMTRSSIIRIQKSRLTNVAWYDGTAVLQCNDTILYVVHAP